VDDLGAANVILTNGARLYVDPRASLVLRAESPTRATPWIWDKAASASWKKPRSRRPPSGQRRLQLYQEQHRRQGRQLRHATRNYLMARSTPFTSVIGV